jgi:hypothetical protein
MIKLIQRLFDYHGDWKYQIIIAEAQKLADVFDDLNKQLCSTCSDQCCRNCAKYSGFFKKSYDFFDKNRDIQFLENMERLKKRYKFNGTFGFFNNRKKICKLPREFRSRQCLSYICPKMHNIIPQDIRLNVHMGAKIMQLSKKEAMIPY